jgi:ABC-type antimicrobial peptide transport system permease subunit
MVEIGRGGAEAIDRSIASLGASVIQVDPSDSAVGGVSAGAGSRVTLTPEDCDAIRDECDAVRWAAPSVDCHTQVVCGNQNWAPRNILGTTPDYFIIRQWTNLVEGAPFTSDDVRRAAGVCLIGQTPARGLFGTESPLGKEIRVRGARLKIVGVLGKKGASVTGVDQDDFFIAPWTTVKYRLSSQRLATQGPPVDAVAADQVNTLNKIYPGGGAQLYAKPSAAQTANSLRIVRFSDLDDIWVSAVSREAVPKAMEQIRSLLRQRHHLEEGQADDFRMRDLAEISETAAASSRLINQLLLTVATISLVVGGIGIMNIMLVSVTERTREIGLRMAVGARARDVLQQFLAEAVLLCVIGGAIGIAFGRAVSMGVGSFLHWNTLASPAAAIAAMGVSAGIGIAFGFYPAWRASRLDPIEALRYE